MIYEPDPLFSDPQDPPQSQEPRPVQGPPPAGGDAFAALGPSTAAPTQAFSPDAENWLQSPLGLPPAYTFADVGLLARAMELPSAAELLSGAEFPGLARHLSRAPQDARVWTDEAGTLRTTEDTWSNLGRSFMDGLYTTNRLGMIYFAERHGGASAEDLAWAKEVEQRRPLPDHWYNNVANIAGNIAFYGATTVTGAFSGSAAGPGGTAIGAAVAPFLASNVVSGGLLYHRMRQADVPHEVASPLSMLGGAVTSGLEYLGGRWLSQAGARVFMGNAAKETVEQLTGTPRLFNARPVAERLASGVGVSAQEAATEGLQNLSEDAYAALGTVLSRPANWDQLSPAEKEKYVTVFDSLEKLQDSFSDAASVAWMTFYSMGLGTGAATSAYTAHQMLSNQERIRRGQQNKDILNRVSQIKAGSAVASDPINRFEEVLQAQAEVHGGEVAYFDRARLKKVLDAADKASTDETKAAGQESASATPVTDRVGELLPQLTKDLDNPSVRTVAVPTAALADKLGDTAVGEALLGEVFLDPDDMPLNVQDAVKELNTLQTRKIEAMKEVENKWVESLDQAMQAYEAANPDLANLPRASRYALGVTVRGWLIASSTEGVMPMDVWQQAPVSITTDFQAQPAVGPQPSLTEFTHPLWRELTQAQRDSLTGTRILAGGVLEDAGDNVGPAVVYRLLGNQTMDENTFIVGEPSIEQGGGVSAAFVNVRNPFVEGQTLLGDAALQDLIEQVRGNEAKARGDIDSDAAKQTRARERTKGKRPKREQVVPVTLQDHAIDTFEGLVRVLAGTTVNIRTEAGRMLAESRALKFLKKHGYDAVVDADIGTVRVLDKGQIVGERTFTEQQHFDQYFPKSEGGPATGVAATYNLEDAEITIHHRNNPIATMHEMMHHITMYLEQVTRAPNRMGTAQARQMWQSLLKSWRTTEEKYQAASAETKRRWYEQTAFQFEVFLTTGEAPEPEFTSLFRFIRRWATALVWGATNSYTDSRRAIFKQIYGRDLPVVSKELAEVFTTLLGVDANVQMMEATRNVQDIAASSEELAEIIDESNPNLPAVDVPPINEDNYQAALELLKHNKTLTPSALKRMLGVGLVTARRLWNRLLDEGHLTETVDGERTVVRPLPEELASTVQHFLDNDYQSVEADSLKEKADEAVQMIAAGEPDYFYYGLVELLADTNPKLAAFVRDTDVSTGLTAEQKKTLTALLQEVRVELDAKISPEYRAFLVELEAQRKAEAQAAARRAELVAIATAKREAQLKAEPFRTWFSGSKVAYENGNPIPVYHGTTSTKDLSVMAARRSKRVGDSHAILGTGIYFTTKPAFSANYSGVISGDTLYPNGRTIRAYLRIRKPFVVGVSSWGEAAKQVAKDALTRTDGAEYAEYSLNRHTSPGRLPVSHISPDDIQAMLKADGYDGVKDGHIWVAFEPNQIKSAIGNDGSYSLTEPSMLRSDVSPVVDAAYEEYQQLSEEVREELKEQATADGMKAMAWYRNARARMTREAIGKPAAERLEKLQLEEWKRRRLKGIHRARHFFRTKQFLDEQGNPVPVTIGRMNTAAVTDLVPAKTLKLISSSALAARGSDPRAVAALFGYDNVVEFLTDLAHAPSVVDEVRQAAGDRLKAENPELVAGTKEADIRVDELMHSELRARKYALELKLLAGLKSSHQELAAAARLQGIGDVRRRLVAEIDSKRGVAPAHKVYQAEENKAALEVNNALAAKANPGEGRGKRPKRDLDRAIDAKTRQLYAHERARAALAARQDIRKRLAKAKKVLGRSNASLAQGHMMHLITVARDLAVRVGIDIGKRESNPYQLQAARAYAEQHFAEALGSADKVVNQILAAGLLRDGMDGRKVQSMSYAEFDEVMQSIEGLIELARDERKAARAARKLDVNVAALEFEEHLRQWQEANPKAAGKPAPGTAQDITDFESAMGKLAGLRTSLTKMLAWCVRMDGSVDGGPFTKYLWNGVNEADHNARHHNHEIQRRLAEILDPLRSQLRGDPIHDPDLEYTFTRSQVFAAYLHCGNYSNKSKLARGGRGSEGPRWLPDDPEDAVTSRIDKFMSRMTYEGVLTPEMTDAAQQIWDLYAELLPQTQQAYFEVNGTNFKIVEVQPFTITFRDGSQKVYAGGYVPARTDENLHTYLTGEPSTRMGQDFLDSLPTVGSTWSIERSPTAAQPLTLDPDLLFTHMSEMVNYIHLQPALKQVNSILLNDRVAAAIRKRDRTALNGLIWPWLKRVAAQQIFLPSDNALDRSVDWLRRRASMMLMSLNVVNALQNAVNPVPVLGLGVSRGTLANAYLRCLKRPRDMADAATQKSAMLNHRLESYSHLLHEQIKGTLKPGFWSALSNARRWYQEKVAYFLQIQTQRWSDLVTWHATYDQAVLDGKSDVEAVAQADKMLQLVMGSFNPIDSTAFSSNSAVHHAAAQFSDYFVTLANATASGLSVKAHNGASFATLGLTAATMWIVPLVVGEMISKAFRGLDDEEYDYDSALANYSMALAREMYLAPLRGMAQAIPLYGQITQAMLNRIATEDAYDDKLRMPPAASLLMNLSNAAGRILTLDVDRNYLDNLLELGGAMSGFAVPRPLIYGTKLLTEEKPTPESLMELGAGFIGGGRRASF